MKILFTGSTSKQTRDNAAARALVDRIDDCTLMINALKASGHEVERRLINWGEDLSNYDLAIVGMAPFGSFNSTSILQAMYALTKDMPILILHEDWKIHDTVNSFKTILKKEGALLKTSLKETKNGNRMYPGTDNPNFDILKVEEVINRLVNGDFCRLVPKFNWGNMQLVADILEVDVNNIYNVDLTPYVLEAEGIQPLEISQNREMKYMIASLVDHTKWISKLKLNYEVDYFGCKSLKSPILNNEYAVYAAVNEYWGSLCPKYPHAGSGWFRIRYIYSALNKSLLLLDKEDAEALGIEEKRLEDFDNIEDLKAFIEIQSSAILSHLTTKDDMIKAIDKAVTETYNKFHKIY